MKDGEKIENSSQKKSSRVLSLIIVYTISILILFFVMFFFRINPFIIAIIIVFISLLLIGSILKRRKQKSLYSELYPEKNQELIQRPQRKFELNIKAEPEEPTEKKFREINLDFKYSKALINKCENCGMTITGYNTNCPICGKAIEMKGVITKCKKCGITIPRSVKKCPVCGTRVT